MEAPATPRHASLPGSKRKKSREGGASGTRKNKSASNASETHNGVRRKSSIKHGRDNGERRESSIGRERGSSVQTPAKSHAVSGMPPDVERLVPSLGHV